MANVTKAPSRGRCLPGNAEHLVTDSSVQAVAVSSIGAEAQVLAEFLTATRDNELADIQFKRRRGFFGLVVAVVVFLVSWRLPHEVKLPSEVTSAMLSVFVGSPLIVGVRSNLDRIRAYEAMQRLLVTPGADANAVEGARQFLKKTLGGST